MVIPAEDGNRAPALRGEDLDAVSSETPDHRRMGSRWDAAHARRAGSQTLRRVQREVYGDDYFEDVVPNSFYHATLSDLKRVARELRTSPRHILVDLGCGSGAPAVWVIRETCARVIGVDLSGVGLEQARERARAWGVQERARVGKSDLCALGLKDASCDGAMSLDAIDVIPRAADRSAAIREAARVLKPGGRMVLATWEQDRLSPTIGPPRDPVSDYRPMLLEAGFEVETYIESPDWKPRDRLVNERILQAELRDELDADSAEALLRVARISLDSLESRRRVVAVAVRPI